MTIDKKRAHGQFYTQGNPFVLRPFRNWANKVRLSEARILEPFAGANNIIHTLAEMGLCKDFAAYDLMPAHKDVKPRDTIKRFPKGFDICVTNPPWLARNSATRRNLPFPNCKYDDLYKHCLDLCLANCRYVAALVPASYLRSGLFQERLQTYISLKKGIFNETENPVCLALFNDVESDDVTIYHDKERMGTLKALEELLENMLKEKSDKKVRFNDPDGELGFISFDNTKARSIRFCHGEEVEDYDIKVSSRFITRISGEFGNIPRLIRKLNDSLDTFRKGTQDIFLTPFKGLRKNGHYRRRMEFALARRLINAM